MNGLKISFAVVAFVLIQGVAVIWYVSKLDSRVDQMYKSFEEENKKEVIENQVKIKLDLENLITKVSQLNKDMRNMQSKDKEILKGKIDSEIKNLKIKMLLLFIIYFSVYFFSMNYFCL